MSTTTISPDEFARLCGDNETPLLIDVRTPVEFARVHVRGAVCIPLDTLDPAAVAVRRRRPDEPIYLICHSGSRAAEARRRLTEAGVTPVICIEGGTAAWEKFSLPVERGRSGVISLERQVRIGAGLFVLVGVALSWLAHPLFLIVPALIGAGLIFAGVTDRCGLALLLTRMPWNRATGGGSGCPAGDKQPTTPTSSTDYQPRVSRASGVTTASMSQMIGRTDTTAPRA